jgi:hypothetical protein
MASIAHVALRHGGWFCGLVILCALRVSLKRRRYAHEGRAPRKGAKADRTSIRGVDDDGNGAVIDDVHAHHRAEDPVYGA